MINIKDRKITYYSWLCYLLTILFTSSEQKYGGFLLNCTNIPLIVLCWKSQQSTLSVDFKIESVLPAKRKKAKLGIDLADEEIGAATVDSQ